MAGWEKGGEGGLSSRPWASISPPQAAAPQIPSKVPETWLHSGVGWGRDPGAGSLLDLG